MAFVFEFQEKGCCGLWKRKLIARNNLYSGYTKLV